MKEISLNIPSLPITLFIRELFELVLGRKGQTLGSKSMGDPLTIFNSNIVIGTEIIWYGDINIDKKRNNLMDLAKLFNKPIEIYYESPIRQFCFNEKCKKEKLDNEAKAIDKTTPVWTTENPNKFNGISWENAWEKDYKNQQINIKNKRIWLGILTPNGTEWSFINKLWYRGPHKIYRVFVRNWKTFISYPIECVNLDKTIDNINIKPFEFKRDTKAFFKYLIREINYHKEEIKNNPRITWKSLLWGAH